MNRPAALLAALVLLTGCGGAASKPAAGTTPTARATPVADCVDPADQAASGVTLTSAGLQLDALVYGSGRTGIVYANMSGDDLCDWYATALVAAKGGYRTAVFNYSGAAADADVLAVAAELRRRGATTIALVGASKGGTAVLTAAARTPVAAVVELSAPDTFEGMDALGAVAKVTAPTWFGVGEFDADFVPSAHRLYAASPARTKHLEVAPSDAHGTALFTGTIERQVGAFLAANAPAR